VSAACCLAASTLRSASPTPGAGQLLRVGELGPGVVELGRPESMREMPLRSFAALLSIVARTLLSLVRPAVSCCSPIWPRPGRGELDDPGAGVGDAGVQPGEARR